MPSNLRSHILLCAIFTLCLLSSTLADYDPKLGAEYGTLSMLAYCSKDELTQDTCPFKTKELDKGYTFVDRFALDYENGELSYTLFVNTKTKKFVSSYRGTNTQKQLETERGLVTFGGKNPFVPTYYDLHTPPVAKTKVTEYFYEGYLLLKETYRDMLKKAVKDYPNYTFVFTGHSLGAALCTHAALDAVLSKIVPSNRVVLYNYGSPRVGDQNFADWVMDKIPEIARVTYSEDLVVHFPTLISGYRHIAPEIFYFGSDAEKKQCTGWAAKNLAKISADYVVENTANYRICSTGDSICCSAMNPGNLLDSKDHHMYPGFNKAAQDYRTSETLITWIESLFK